MYRSSRICEALNVPSVEDADPDVGIHHSLQGKPSWLARQEIAMHFDERNEGDYRIYAGALEAPYGDGYIAAVVVNRVTGAMWTPREAFRDTSISCGHRWPSASDALSYAVARALELIRTEPHRLAC
jgi:hypothetical protein